MQRRVQRYGWDLAASHYERLWQEQLSEAQATMLARVALRPGERVLDVACGTGLVALDAARAVGAEGGAVGVDISGGMVLAARRHAEEQGVGSASFRRMDGESLDLPDASFDVALCALGLMYMPDPEQALREMHRVLRPGGRAGLAVWGERNRCGWSPVFPIVDAGVASDVCPLFFCLGADGALPRACRAAGFVAVQAHRIETTLCYRDSEQACDAAFVGGPVALAWSRLDARTRERMRAEYREAIAPWKVGRGYRLPGEFVVAVATRD